MRVSCGSLSVAELGAGVPISLDQCVGERDQIGVCGVAQNSDLADVAPAFLPRDHLCGRGQQPAGVSAPGDGLVLVRLRLAIRKAERCSHRACRSRTPLPLRSRSLIGLRTFTKGEPSAVAELTTNWPGLTDASGLQQHPQRHSRYHEIRTEGHDDRHI